MLQMFFECRRHRVSEQKKHFDVIRGSFLVNPSPALA